MPRSDIAAAIPRLDCVIPAAGESRRMGTPKQAVRLGGTPLIALAVERALEFSSRVIVVVGAHIDVVRPAIPDLPGVEVLEHPGFRRGMVSSIAAGAARVRTPWFYVAPADMPALPADAFRGLAMEAAKDPPADALFPVTEARRGHPVLIRSSLVPDLLRRWERVSSMREFLEEYRCAEIRLADDGIHRDIDTPSELSDELRRWNSE